MPQNHGGNSRKFYKPKGHHQHQRVSNNNSDLDEKNPVLKAFKGYAQELDAKYDRNERIVKLSRDITIESKRIIFLLHTIDGRKNNKAKILEEAQQRLDKVIEVNFKAVAKELLGHDANQFRSAYSPGLQEFIEAFSFMEYYKWSEDENVDGSAPPPSMSDWNALRQRMQYVEQTNPVVATVEEEKEADSAEQSLTEAVQESVKFEFFVDPTEYILGVSDLTGELMRRCINSLGSGETDTCLDTCQVLKDFYTGYISLNVQRCRELSRKIYTMRQSVLKAELCCYNVVVRGGEAAKWGLVFDSKHPADDVDEGFF